MCGTGYSDNVSVCDGICGVSIEVHVESLLKEMVMAPPPAVPSLSVYVYLFESERGTNVINSRVKFN